MAATLQAQRVIDALKGIGLKHGSWRKGGDFIVRTEITRRRDSRTGIRYSEFGHATARLQNRARGVVEEHADALAAQGIGVILVYGKDDALVTAIVSSTYNRKLVVAILDGNGNWSYRGVAAA